MAREIDRRRDFLVVEGPDDGAVVNAYVKKALGLDLTAGNRRIVRTKEDGAGDSWALEEFAKYVREAKEDARVGLIVDRDGADNDKWPTVQSSSARPGTGDGGTVA